MSQVNGKKEQGFVGSDDRLKKPVDPGRESRAAADAPRTNEDGTAFTVEERRKLFRNEFSQEALPTPPEIPGYHLCWLSTTNSYDPIHRRIRIGYEPVRADDVRGFEPYRMKGGDWDGFVGCNEMVLFKIPNEIYQEIMATVHHDMPLEEERKIREQAMAMGQDSSGKSLASVEEGIADLANRPVRRPHFNP